MKPICVLSVVFISLLAFGAAVAAQPMRLQTPRTSLLLYTPLTGGGGVASGVHIAKTASGDCWTGSSLTRRTDAYRCMVVNLIHDPCFADESGSATFVLCPVSRPGSRVLKLKLTAPLPRNVSAPDPMRFAPWAVRLAGGRWCVALGGATAFIAGLRINYGCDGGGMLIGEPRRVSRTWTVLYGKGTKPSQFRAVPVAAAWW